MEPVAVADAAFAADTASDDHVETVDAAVVEGVVVVVAVAGAIEPDGEPRNYGQNESRDSYMLLLLLRMLLCLCLLLRSLLVRGSRLLLWEHAMMTLLLLEHVHVLLLLLELHWYLNWEESFGFEPKYLSIEVVYFG